MQARNCCASASSRSAKPGTSPSQAWNTKKASRPRSVPGIPKCIAWLGVAGTRRLNCIQPSEVCHAKRADDARAGTASAMAVSVDLGTGAHLRRGRIRPNGLKLSDGGWRGQAMNSTNSRAASLCSLERVLLWSSTVNVLAVGSYPRVLRQRATNGQNLVDDGGNLRRGNRCARTRDSANRAVKPVANRALKPRWCGLPDESKLAQSILVDQPHDWHAVRSARAQGR